MRNILLGMWKTFVVTATGLVFAWLANHGIHLSDDTASVLTVALVAFGLAAYNAVVNWLLARTGDDVGSKLLRGLGKVLSLGGEAPKYPTAYAPDGGNHPMVGQR